jgi:hypothetical protein
MKNISIKEQLTGKKIFLVKDWSNNILGAFIYYGEACEFANKCEKEAEQYGSLITMEEIELQ